MGSVVPPNTRFSARRHLEDVILTWWDRNGADDIHGGVFTCFSNRGRPESHEKYTWSQGRWAWLCAEVARDARAGLLDVDPATWSGRAIKTAQFVSDHAVLPGGLTAFRTSALGDPLPSGPNGELSTSVFADLFAALGLAGASRLPECPDGLRARFVEQADAILASAAVRIRDRTAQSAPYPVRSGFTDMAGPMTLLHVASELSKASGSSASSQTLNYALAELLQGHGKPPLWGTDRWWEFRPDAPGDSASLLARHKTPGHLLECLWMAIDAADAAVDPIDLPTWLPDLARHALDIGWDERDGGLFRYVDETGGAPRGRLFGDDRYELLVQDTWDTKLWWVHVEAMYATRLLARRYDDPELERWSSTITDYTMRTFPDPAGQEWIQIRDRGGRPLDKVVALPVKDPFHIARTLLLLNRLERESRSTAEGFSQ